MVRPILFNRLNPMLRPSGGGQTCIPFNNSGLRGSFRFSTIQNGESPKLLKEYTDENGSKVTIYRLGDGGTATNIKKENGDYEYEYRDVNGRIGIKDSRTGNVKNEYMYDEYGNVSRHREVVYDETDKSKTPKETSSVYENGVLVERTVFENDSVVVTKFDENGNGTKVFERRGSVLTYFDDNGNPIRRETDKGQGIIETEDLTQTE